MPEVAHHDCEECRRSNRIINAHIGFLGGGTLATTLAAGFTSSGAWVMGLALLGGCVGAVVGWMASPGRP